jgi:hypothetical protein
MSTVRLLTEIHTAISLAALILALPMLLNLIFGRLGGFWSDAFLILALACTVTGFMFPFGGVTPAFATGLIASAIFAVTLLARFVFRYRGHWRWLYAAGMVLSAYLIAFVAVVQAFLKLEPVNALAPTQTEPPFLIAQLAVLAAFIVLTILGGIRFKAPAPRLVPAE